MKIAPHEPQISVEEVNVVLIGHFNPLIFQPAWFAKEGLLRESEAADANVVVLHPDVASFSTEWLVVQITHEQFSASIKADVYCKHFSDLVVGTFQKLSHTPIKKMGINTQSRLSFKSSDEWHALGHLLTPKSPWNGVLQASGMRNLQVQGQRDDSYMGHIVVTVRPDLDTCTDVLLRVNDHYESPDPTGAESAAWVSKILSEAFDKSIARSKDMAAGLVKNFLKTTEVDAGEP